VAKPSLYLQVGQSCIKRKIERSTSYDKCQRDQIKLYFGTILNIRTLKRVVKFTGIMDRTFVSKKTYKIKKL